MAVREVRSRSDGLGLDAGVPATLRVWLSLEALWTDRPAVAASSWSSWVRSSVTASSTGSRRVNLISRPRGVTSPRRSSANSAHSPAAAAASSSPRRVLAGHGGPPVGVAILPDQACPGHCFRRRDRPAHPVGRHGRRLVPPTGCHRARLLHGADRTATATCLDTPAWKAYPAASSAAPSSSYNRLSTMASAEARAAARLFSRAARLSQARHQARRGKDRAPWRRLGRSRPSPPTVVPAARRRACLGRRPRAGPCCHRAPRPGPGPG